MMNLTMKMVDLKGITDNYKTDEDIIVETGNDIENVLDFNWNGEFRFIHCGSCGGPILGHSRNKCRALNNVRYSDELVKAFEEKIQAMNGFRKKVKKYRENGEEKESCRQVKEIEALLSVSVRAALEHYNRKKNH